MWINQITNLYHQLLKNKNAYITKKYITINHTFTASYALSSSHLCLLFAEYFK